MKKTFKVALSRAKGAATGAKRTLQYWSRVTRFNIWQQRQALRKQYKEHRAARETRRAEKAAAKERRAAVRNVHAFLMAGTLYIFSDGQLRAYPLADLLPILGAAEHKAIQSAQHDPVKRGAAAQSAPKAQKAAGARKRHKTATKTEKANIPTLKNEKARTAFLDGLRGRYVLPDGQAVTFDDSGKRRRWYLAGQPIRKADLVRELQQQRV